MVTKANLCEKGDSEGTASGPVCGNVNAERVLTRRIHACASVRPVSSFPVTVRWKARTSSRCFAISAWPKKETGRVTGSSASHCAMASR